MSMAAPPPIPGEPVDPPPRSAGRTLDAIRGRTQTGGTLYRAFLRFTGSHGLLVSAGTTYYLFLSIFSLITLAFGLTALIGSDLLAENLSHALDEGLPGLIGSGGVDAGQLRTLGQSTSLIGLVVLIYSGTGAMGAASSGLHLIFGAPRDPRNFLKMRLRFLAWFALLAPLFAISLAPSLLVSQVGDPALRFVGLADSGWAEWIAVGAGYAISLAVNLLIVRILYSRFGGIKPRPRPMWLGAALASVGIELLRLAVAGVVAWALARPQYGAFAVPIALMLVFYLQCLVFYFCAALVAALATERGGAVPEALTTVHRDADPFGETSPIPVVDADAGPPLVPPQARVRTDREAGGPAGVTGPT
jgi:membrane protein